MKKINTRNIKIEHLFKIRIQKKHEPILKKL